MTTTTNMAEFGYIEREEAEKLLKASRLQGFPEDFSDDEVTIMFNTMSGSVFFTNAEYQTAMMNGEDLESFYSCPVCGHEGFLDEMEHGENDKECQEYLIDIKGE